MEERLFAPDSFFIKSVPTNADVFVCKGKAISFEGEKRLFDMAGTALFFMTHQFNSVRQFQVLLDKRNGDIYSVMKKGFWPGRGRGTLLVRSGKGKGGNVVLEVKSNASRSESEIWKDGNLVAKTERSLLGGKRLSTGLDSYKLRVETGFDVPLAIMLTVCIDEQYTEGLA